MGLVSWTAVPVPSHLRLSLHPTHTGLQLQLVEGALVVVAKAAVENDGAIEQDLEEVLAVRGARDDLRQHTVRPGSPMALPQRLL